ncbi:MAG: alpha/beta fold hydrolase [Burkholderiaceae bacterium]|jgi:pimeloyl-ACP methyl ester carboxylesterase
MTRVLLAITGFAALGYVCFCAVLCVFQRSMIYFPQALDSADAKSLTMLDVSGAKLVLSTRPHAGASALIYFGGNAEEVSSNLPSLSAAFPDHAIYLLHYRGYGGSSGAPTEEALQKDALAVFDWVHAQHPSILVIGRSLGSGVAVYLASLRPVARLVLVTPYDSIEELAAMRFPYVPVRWLLRDKFESFRYAPKITAPTTIVEAEHDEIIPAASTERLFSRFPKGVATLHVVSGAGHNSVSDDPSYERWLKGF